MRSVEKSLNRPFTLLFLINLYKYVAFYIKYCYNIYMKYEIHIYGGFDSMKKFVAVVCLMGTLMMMLTGCTSVSDTLHKASGTEVSKSDEVITSDQVLHDIMYFYDETDDAICIVENGYVSVACVNDFFYNMFVVNGTALCDGQYNFEYTYNKPDLYITMDSTKNIIYKFIQYEQADFDSLYKEFEERFTVKLEEYAEENNIDLEDFPNGTASGNAADTVDLPTNADETSESDDTKTEASDDVTADTTEGDAAADTTEN